MVSVIRDIDSERHLPRAKGGGIWKFLLFLFAAIALGAAYHFNQIYGVRALVVFGALAALGLLLFLVQLFKKPDTAALRVTVPVSNVLERVFARSAHPGLIIENNRAVRANDSYIELLATYDLTPTDGIPQHPEKIFEDTTDAVQSAIYRLSHLAEDEAFGEEEIEFLNGEGVVKRYLLRVTLFNTQQYWEIIDLSYDAATDPSLLVHAPVGLCAVNEKGNVISANSTFREWIGKDELTELTLPEIIENADGILDSPKDADRLIRFDTRLMTNKDITTPVVVGAKWTSGANKEKIASLAFYGHSSIAINQDRAKTSGAVAQPAAKTSISTLVDIPFAMVEIDDPDLSKARIKNGNKAFEALIGKRTYEDLLLSNIIGPTGTGIDLTTQNLKNIDGTNPLDGVIKGKDGAYISIYPNIDPVSQGLRLYLVDISARKALEDQLVQSQKMQAIGRLVAEIAHDFNNLLAAIRLYTDTLLGRHPIGDPSYPELQQINANGNRAAALVKKLLAYSRKQTIRAERLDVSETLSDMAVTLKQVLGEKVNLEIKHARDLPAVRVDKSQFDTVLMNLAVNARDAMKEKGGGLIAIESGVMVKSEIDQPMLKAALDHLEASRVVSISVKDTGSGMSDEVKDKIFEPFFTTKGQGEGTGLGLATVYGIVQQSGGHLMVESEIGKGTTFTIYLPEAQKLTSAEEKVAADTRKPVAKVSAPLDLAGQGNILFVEDEVSVRVIAAKTLRKRGYNVVEAGDGEEAYEIIEETETPFDLMISDVVMPGMDGPTLLKKARPMLGNTRIVFISGYAEEEFSDLLAEEPDVTFLPKPFTLIQLAEKVKQQIGEVK